MKINDFLLQYKEKHIYYKPNPGNGGDALIAWGTYWLFKKLGIKYTVVNEDTDLTGKVVFFGGGGNLVKEYASASSFISSNLAKVKELVLLPHTINSHEGLLRQLGDNVTLICREKNSFKYIKNLKLQCSSYLIEDMAFSLPVPELQKRLKKNIFPLFLRVYVLRMLRYQGQVLWPLINALFGKKELNAFRIDSEKTRIKLPKDSLDLSLLLLYDLNMTNEQLVERNVIDILSVINKYDVVSTNRLHVCIGAALLGKEVNFYPNSYYKNESIYLMSLKDRYPNVRWCGEVTIHPAEAAVS